jgi:hypothetical protein
MYSQKEKHHAKQDYQDSALNGDVARNWLGLSTGRYFTCPPLLSEAVSTEVMLFRGRESLLSERGCLGWVAGLSWPLTSHVEN